MFLTAAIRTILLSGGDKLSFDLPLLNTLVPAKAANGTPTFTRSSTATMVDFEGLTKLIKSGAARFEGSRYVENICPTPHTFVAGSTATATAGFTDKDGGTTAYQCVYLANSNNSGFACRPTTNANCSSTATYTASIWLKGNSGGESINLHSGWNLIATVVLTTSWVRYSFTFVSTHSTAGVYFYPSTSAATTIFCCFAQIEDVTGQSNQAPSEFIDIGVASAPYYGSAADGVKYFTTQNGNTVASNVVTEASGAGISSSTLKGYLSEQFRTNIILQSQNHATTWAAIGTPTITSANKNYGALVLDLIGDDSALAAEGYSQVITYGYNGKKAIAVFVKQGTSTKSTIRLRDTTAGANRLNAEITWSGAVPVVTMITGTVERPQISLIDGVYRLFLLTDTVTSANNNQIEIYPAADNTLSILDTGDINIGGWQAEDHNTSSSYIITTTGIISRSGDLLFYLSSGNFNSQADYTIYAEVVYNPNSSTEQQILLSTDSDFTGYYRLCASGNRIINFYSDNSGSAVASLTRTLNECRILSKYAGIKKSSSISVFVNGTKGSDNTIGTQPTIETKIYIAGYKSNSYQTFGTIKNFKIYKKALSDSKIIGMTT